MAPTKAFSLQGPFLLFLIAMLPHESWAIGQTMMMMNTHVITTYRISSSTVELGHVGMSCACSHTVVKHTKTTHLTFEGTYPHRQRQAPLEIEIEFVRPDHAASEYYSPDNGVIQAIAPKRIRRVGSDAIDGPTRSAWSRDGQHIAMNDMGHSGHGLVQDAFKSRRVPIRATRKGYGHEDGDGEAYLPHIQYF